MVMVTVFDTASGSVPLLTLQEYDPASDALTLLMYRFALLVPTVTPDFVQVNVIGLELLVLMVSWKLAGDPSVTVSEVGWPVILGAVFGSGAPVTTAPKP